MWVLTSPGAIFDGRQVRPDVVAALRELSIFAGVGVVSNGAEPKWFESTFDGSDVIFRQVRGRQRGSWLREHAAKKRVPLHQVLVLAANGEDLQMAKNNGALLIGAGWAEDQYVAKAGLKVAGPDDLLSLVRLAFEWDGRSWFRAEGDYTVEALCDASSTQYKSEQQQRFGRAVMEAVKEGAPSLNSILALAASSLIRAGLSETENLFWGVYPSSSSSNDDTEVLSDFAYRLRTTVSRVQFAKRGEPLFHRHRPAPKRSAGEGGDREDPAGEVESLHLNPFYRTRLKGRNVVLLDDFTTYGVSMGVAFGFLRAAGARSMTGIALGKLGDRLGNYDLQVISDPFQPVSGNGWIYQHAHWDRESPSSEDQETLRELLLP